MKNIFILNVLIHCSLTIFGQSRALDYYSKADSLNFAGAMEAAFLCYDTAAQLYLQMSDLNGYIEAVIGKGRAKRYDEKSPRYEEALNYFDQAFLLLTNLDQPNENDMASLFYHLATTHRELTNYKKALEYGFLALHYGKELGDSAFIAKTHSVLANSYSGQNNPKAAVHHYQQAISTRTSMHLPHDEILPLYYHNLANHYLNAQEHIQSIKYLQQSLSIYEGLVNQTPVKNALINAEIAWNYCRLGELESARTFYERAVNATLHDSSRSDTELFSLYWYFGKIQDQFNQQDSALHFFHKTLVCGIPGFDSDHVLESPSLSEAPLANQLFVEEDIYRVLDDKGIALQKLYDETADQRYLQNARSTYNLADEIMFRQRFNLQDDDPSLHLAGHSKSIYERALNVLYQLYQHEDRQEFIEEAFQYLDRNKHTILFKNKLINNRILFEEDYDNRIKILQYKIDQLRRDINQTQDVDDRNNEFNARLISEVVGLHHEKKKIIDQQISNEDLTRYGRISLQDFRDFLSKRQLMISYFWGKEWIFAIAISRTSVIFERIPRSQLEENIAKLVSTFNVERLYSLDYYNQFTQSAFAVYTDLVQPILDSINNPKMIDELIIIPDGFLNRLSFSALIQESSSADKLAYDHLHYLIYDYNINYAFSASILLEDKKIVKKGCSLLGFSNSRLKGTREELSRIAGIWKGNNQVNYGLDATETAFKSVISEFDIIHLATHGDAGKNEEDTFLEFNLDSTSTDDGKLFNYEIYPLKLNARLVTLSACETGLGENLEGEGTYSLARSFNFVGVPTIVMSLWKVHDYETSQLMPVFYDKLQKHQPISTALRNAQLQFLAEADEFSAHPFLWSGFVVIGNGSQVFEGVSGRSLLTTVFLFLVIGFVVYIYVTRKQRVRNAI